MFSKENLCFLLSFVLVMTSCTPKVGEAPPEIGQQKLSGIQCLSGLQLVVEAFIDGNATDAAVASGWDCASTAITTFKKYVYGRTDDRFEATELADFLKKNFLEASSPDITPALRVEIMRIKQLFLGGSIDYVTRAELDKIVSMLGEFKNISLHLNPYMKLIAQKWTIAGSADIQEDVRYFEKASDEIQSSARALANMIIENNQSYELDRFITFLREFLNFSGQDWPIANEIERDMPVVKKVKKAISGGDQNTIGATEWKSFVLLGARGYLQYLRYFYFIKSASEMGSGIRLGYLARSLEDLLGAFQDLVEQKPADAACGVQNRACISKQEISEILTTFSNISEAFPISDKLIDEAMKLKKVYLGGSDLSITSRDFERGKNKVAGLKLVVEKFLPYFQVYSLEWDRGNFDPLSAERFFKEAQQSLKTSAESFGALFEESYDINNLKSLLGEIDRLYPTNDPENHPALAMQKMIPLVKDVKNIIFSEDNAKIKKEQWSSFLKFSASFYNSYLFHYYFLKQETYGTTQFLEAFKKMTDQILDVVKDVVLAKKNNKILPESEINILVNRMASLDIIPKSLKPESLRRVVDVVLNRVMWPAEFRLEAAVPNGITSQSVDNIRLETQIWYETERYLYSLTASPMKPVDLQAQVAKKLKDRKISAELRAGLNEISMMIAGQVPQPIDSKGRLIITNISKLVYDSASVARLNLNRLAGRVFIRAATTSLNRLKAYEGVDLAEAQTLFDFFRPAIVELGLLDKSNTSFVESRFREANIFSAHSNGDAYVNFPEMTDIVGMIQSGVTLNKMFRKDIIAACVGSTQDQTELFAQESCIRKVYLKQTENYMAAMPEYIKFFKHMDLGEYSEFLGNVLKAAGHVANDQGSVNLLNSDLAPHVVQYIEMTLAKFDANKNGIIDLPEAKTAFSSFKGILTELTKDQSLIKKKDLLALFTYILHYGKPPGGVKDYFFSWLPWKSDPEDWEVSANRKDLAGILGYIADQVAKDKANKKALIPKEEEDAIRNHPDYDDKD
jgi:hypothetical protein